MLQLDYGRYYQINYPLLSNPRIRPILLSRFLAILLWTAVAMGTAKRDASIPIDETPAKLIKRDEDTATSSSSSCQPLASLPQITPATSKSTSRSESMQSSSLSEDDARQLVWREAKYDCNHPENVTKREDYLSWDEYFFGIAALSARRSKSPHQPSGCCIVDSSNRIVGIGYDGFPTRCSDDELPWDQPQQGRPTLHTYEPYLVPAIINAILNKWSSDNGSMRLYTQFFPCHESAKVILQSRCINEVIYLEDRPDENSSKASRIMLQLANIPTRKYAPKRQTIELTFREGELSSPIQPTTPTTDYPHRELLLKEANYDVLKGSLAKNQNYLSWDDYFLAASCLTSKRSKDPNTQVGACIVDENKRIVGLGYNGFPVHCSDDVLPWSREADHPLHKKYMYVCHAEANAIMNKGSANVKGATMYVDLFPCNTCAKMIIQSGIKEVVYMHDFYHEKDTSRASRVMLKMAGITLRHYTPSMKSICLNLTQSTDKVKDF